MSVLSLISRLKKLDIRIELLDNQLKLNAPEGTLNPGIINELKAKKKELIEFLKESSQNRLEYASIKASEKKEYYILSSVQKRLYILHQMVPGNISYNLPNIFSLEGEIDVKKLDMAFKRLVHRHESLRTSFEMINEEHVQKIHEQVEFDIQYNQVDVEEEKNYKIQNTKYKQNTNHKIQITNKEETFGQSVDASGGDQFPKSQDLRAKSFIYSFIRPFDLSGAPLLRVRLITLSKERHLLLFDMHHIITDATSISLLIKDFTSFYRGEDLPVTRTQYKDYSEWQNSKKISKEMKQQEEFWLKEFEGEIPVLNLPTDYTRPVVQSFEGNTISFEIEKEETGLLKDFTLKEDATLYMVLLSIYTIFLSKLTNQEDIVVGTAIAGRRHADLESIIGMFVNTLVLRNFPVMEKTFDQFLKEIKENTIKAFENQDYLYEDLVEQIKVERDTGRNPLFDTMFALQDMDSSIVRIPGLKVIPYHYESHISKFDLTLTAIEKEDRLAFTFEYCTRIFKKETIRRFISFFKKTVSFILENVETRISGIEIISGEEKNRVLQDFNDTGAEYPCDKTIQQLFAEQMKRTPHRIAVMGPRIQTATQICSGGNNNISITYKELNRRSGQLAYLLKEKGVEAGAIVGIMVERSLEMIIGLLGIFKAGGAYLPIDPGYPRERIDYMLKDSGADILLTGLDIADFSSALAFNIRPQGASFYFHLSPSSATSLAYVIYTSGSTGKPKGVLITNRNICPLLHWGFHNFGLGPKARTLQNLSYFFDWSAWEIFITLTSGGGLYIAPLVVILNPDATMNFIKTHAVTVLHITPTQFQYLLNVAGNLKTLDYLFIGAEKLTDDVVRRGYDLVREDCRVFNMYGPTEATIISATLEIRRSDEANLKELSSVPIGRPSDNMFLLVLNKSFNICPVRVVGEMYIGGDGLTCGYLNNPELTSEKFVRAVISHSSLVISSSENFSKSTYDQCPMTNDRLYKTGDLARWLSDGNIEFLGRIDHQVKIRGFRIELEEIENQLLTHENIKEAIVMTREENNNDKYLCAYIVAERKAYGAEREEINKLREYLSQYLPDYMVPSYFVQLDGIPLTHNGKVDRKSLPAPMIETGAGYEAPRDDIEKKLVDIWSGVLGIGTEKIGIYDNFFHLGGHSLKATVLVSRIHREFNVTIPLNEIFRTSNIQRLALHIREAAKEEYIAIEVVEKKEYYPLSSAQRRLYILQQMDTEKGIAYNMPSVWQLQGELDVGKMERVFQQLIQRHEGLRTFFTGVNDGPVQRINEENYKLQITKYKQIQNHRLQITKKEMPFGQVFDAFGGSDNEGTRGLAPLPEEPTTRNSQPAAALISSFIRPFDLSQAPLLRVNLVKIERQKHILMVDMHHIISDGLSMGIFVKEFMELYAQKRLPVLRLQYKDYSEWYKSRTGREFIKEQEAYWLKQFEGEVPLLELPRDYPRPSIQSFAGRIIHFEMSKDETAALKSLTREQDVTLFILLLSLYTIFICKLSGQEDIVVGTPIAGRRHTDLQGIIGMFVNTLTLRNFPVMEKTFSQFLKEIKENTIKAFENQDYLYEDLVEQVKVERDTGRNPLFDTMFALQNVDTPVLEIPGLKVLPYDYENRISKFDLTLTAIEKEDRLAFTFEYCTNLFKEETIRRFIGFFKKTVSTVLENRAVRISEIDIINEEEKNRVLLDFNDTGAEYPCDKTIHQLFAEQVKQTPHRIAVMGPQIQTEEQIRSDGNNTISITYNELDEKSNHLAYFLKAKGVLLDTIVGLMVERSIEMLIGILGILKSGSAYLPINTKNPPARTQYMLADSGARIIIRSSDISSSFLSCPSWLNTTSKAFLNLPAGRHVAYVIYTSGSIGNPKGVAITHANFSPLAHWGYKHLLLGPADRTIQNLAYYFDWSVWEIFITLTTGACLYPVREETLLNPELCIKFMQKHAITVLHVTPTQYQYFLHPGWKLETLKYLFIGAEKLTYDLAQRSLKSVLPSCRVINMYGPTEATIISVVLEIHREEIGKYQQSNSIPIGEPVSNFTLLVVDGYLNLCPITIAGELMIQGDGVAQGYLNNPELTAEKFINYKLQITNRKLPTSHSVHSPYLPIYRTGDLCRWLPEGNVEFLGRMDHQVKIRGFRIELGEIESQLLTLEKIKEAIVLYREDNTDKYLCAYIVAERKAYGAEREEINKLREYLSQYLPDYMVPSYFVQLDNIPLTPNGKIDRKALPVPEVETGKNYTAPRNEIEKKLVDIWSEILDVEKEKIGINDNFFHLGGHSLKAALLAAQIHKKLNVSIPLLEIFRAPLLRDFAEYIKKKAAPRKYISIEPVEAREYYDLSSAQKRLYVIQQTDPGSTVYNMPTVMSLIGELHRVKFEGAFKKLIQRHESLRTSFHMLKEKPVQRVHDKVNFEIEYYDFQSNSEIATVSLDDMVENFVRHFDLETAPMLRVSLIKQDAQKHILMIDMNHIISDGTSIGILENEFMALIAGKDPGPLRTRYRDWTQWQNYEKNSERVKNQEAYWLREFEGKIPALNLPCDYTRLAVQDFTGKRVTFALSNLETEYLNTLARQEEVTLYMLLLSVYYVLLYKLTGQEDIIIGAPTAGRCQVELQKIIGMFLNTLALRNFPKGGKPFKIFLKEVKTRVLNAFENQEYQFDDLVDQLELKRGEGRNPLFDVMFILQNQGRPEIQIPGLKLIPVEIEQTTTKFDFSLYAEEVGHELLFSVTFCEKLFTPATITIIIDYFKAILSSVIKNLDQALADINVIPGERRTAILSQLNTDLEGEAKNMMADSIFQTRLNKSFAKFKDSIAIEYTDHSLSYVELDRRSDWVCRWIPDNGIARETFVGILMDNRLDVIVTMIGIIKAGCVIVPFYPRYPIKRIIDMLQVTHLRYLFIDQDNASRFKESPHFSPGKIELIDPQELLSNRDCTKKIKKNPVHYTPDDPFYIHFTSGTTGKPKAIIGRNKGLLHFISWEIETFGISSHFRAAQFTIPGFDPFLRDVFAPLLAGGVVCIPGDEEIVTRPAHLAKWIDMRRISLIHCVTGLFRLLISSGLTPDRFRNLEYILLAGEKTNPSDLVEWYEILGKRVQLVNGYGPTETTMSKAYYLISPRDIHRERIPIGKPLKGSRIVILDGKGKLCSPLLPGEICIRTPFRSLGYYDAGELNQEKFISNPFSDDPGDILYRSGDLGRILADGNIDILGRIDRQVKIRGYRIELEEVEGQLAKHALVKEAVVIKKGISSETEFLCAYITITPQNTQLPPDQETLIINLKESLTRKLPDYMVPANILIIDMIPRKATGKVDFDRLPNPVEKRKTGYIPPRDQVEEKLINLWYEVLKIDKIGIRDDFFELGGNSLNMVSLVSKIHKEFQIKISLEEIFRFQTIEKQSQLIKGAGKDKFLSIEPTEKKEYYRSSAAQKRIYFLQQTDLKSTVYNITQITVLEGDLERNRWEETVKKLLQRHESLKTSFEMLQEELIQEIHEEIDIKIEYHDASKVEVEPLRSSQPTEALISSFIRPFNLSRAPLLRMGLVKIGGKHSVTGNKKAYMLIMDIHHIISDLASISIILKDFLALYEGKELLPLSIQYKDYAEWENSKEQRDVIKCQENYWLKEFAGDRPTINLPLDYPRTNTKIFKGSHLEFTIGKEETSGLKTIAVKEEVTLYIILLAIFNILLAKLSGQEDIVIGTAVEGRRHEDLRNVIGMFVKTLPLRNYPGEEKTFKKFLAEVKEGAVKAFENQDYPFQDLVEKIKINREAGRNPLFDVLFQLDNIDMPEVRVSGLWVMPYKYEIGVSKFDLRLRAVELKESISFTFEYSVRLFKKETIERFIIYFKEIFHQVGKDSNTRLGDMQISHGLYDGKSGFKAGDYSDFNF